MRRRERNEKTEKGRGKIRTNDEENIRKMLLVEGDCGWGEDDCIVELRDFSTEEDEEMPKKGEEN